MKVIIFNDKQNFDGSLSLLNKPLKKGKKRFWSYKNYIPFLIDKLKSFEKLSQQELSLSKSLFYSGKYSSNILKGFKWNCNSKIAELNYLINKEKKFLNYISQQKVSHQMRAKTRKHVEDILKTLEFKKESYRKAIQKQKRNYEGQKELLLELEETPFIEMKTTPLKQSEGKIYQKGVDVMMAVDLVNLAHTGAYDVALILGGDTDFIESVKFIKGMGKIVVVAAFYSQKEPDLNTISDLKNAADYFINLNDLTKQEITKMSELLKP